MPSDAYSRPIVAIAGFQHETNSFSPVAAGIDSFIEGTNWPGLTQGDAILDTFRNLNIPIGGFVDEAARQDFSLAPVLWANATPSGPVRKEAFETIVAKIVDGIGATQGLAAVYLDLHGAMIAEGILDAEAEILRRVRAVVGDQIPVVVSLDLHANVSQEMVDLADALVSCRTYPHVDLAETGAKCARILRTILEGERGRTIKHLFKPKFLIPTQAQSTLLEPAQALYAGLEAIEDKYHLLDISIAMGFGLADTPVVGPSICATAFEGADVEAGARVVAERFEAARPFFGQQVYRASEAIHLASELYRPGFPVILADLQDNPGAGGTGDTTGLLRALIDAGMERAVLAVLYDPVAATLAHDCGAGRSTVFSLGGHVGGPGSTPVEARATVERLGDGQFAGSGPMYRGNPMNYGKMALLRLDSGPRVIVGSVNTQAADDAILRQMGVDVADMDVICLKSGVHFRAAFQPLASAILIVKEDGANPADYSGLPYVHLPVGVDRMP